MSAKQYLFNLKISCFLVKKCDFKTSYSLQVLKVFLILIYKKTQIFWNYHAENYRLCQQK